MALAWQKAWRKLMALRIFSTYVSRIKSGTLCFMAMTRVRATPAAARQQPGSSLVASSLAVQVVLLLV